MTITTTEPRRPELLRSPLRVHRDESGSISIISVFGVMLLAMLLGMVLNSGLQVDQKVKMQNAADAATYSGTVVIARGMNTLAFTNHLLSDVFALTAFMREARERSAERLTPDILDNWERIGPKFAQSDWERFAELGEAIQEKVPREREVVHTFGNWAAAASELMLPVFEQILSDQQIPKFQRAIVRTTPLLAQVAADETARRHGAAWPKPTELNGVLWQTAGDRVVGMGVEDSWQMPVVDPVGDDVLGLLNYRRDAKKQRFELAHRYLRAWNAESLPLFDGYAKMSQFGSLWRIFTGGQLQKLLNRDYSTVNLPCQILTRPGEICDLNEHLEQHFMFVGVVSRKKMRDQIPRVFRNPVASDTHAYAQAMTFVPKRRLIKTWIWPGGNPHGLPRPVSGVPGQGIGLGIPPQPPAPPPPPPPPPPPENGETPEPYFVVVRQNAAMHPEPWTLVNQNWTAQLVPATSSNIPQILSTPPYGSSLSSPNTPDLSEVTADDFLWLSNH